MLLEKRGWTKIGVVEPPSVAERTVYGLEVSPTPNKPAAHVDGRHMMSAFLGTGGNALESNLRGLQFQIHNFNPVAAILPFLDAFDIGFSTQSAFKGEIGSDGGQSIELPEKHAACVQIGNGWLKRSG